MAIEAIEERALLACLMLQDQGGSIIKRQIVIVEAVNHAIQRGQQLGPGGGEQIHTYMQGAGLAAIAGDELLGRVDAAFLIVTTPGHRCFSRSIRAKS